MADNGNITPKWYVLRAISGKEAKVKEYIDAEIANKSLAPYVSQVLIPMEKTFQVRNGKRVVKERNCLPGYVLVQAVMVGDMAFKLRNTPNVVGILGGMDNPVPLQETEVNRLVGRVEEVEGEGDAESLAGGSVFLVLRVVNDPAVAIATVAQPDDGGLDVARDRLPVDRPLKSGDVNDRFH